MAETLEQIYEWCAGFPEWGLCPLLFLLALLQYVFPPVPSDTLLVALGMLVSGNVFHLLYGFLSYTAGSVIGGIVLFEVCFLLGDKVRKIGFFRQHFDEKSLEKARRRIRSYGGAYYLVLRFVPSMQCVTVIVMGLLKCDRLRSRVQIGTVSVIACAVFYFLGLLLGQNLPKLVRILDALGTAGKAILILMLSAAVLIFVIQKITKRNN